MSELLPVEKLAVELGACIKPLSDFARKLARSQPGLIGDRASDALVASGFTITDDSAHSYLWLSVLENTRAESDRIRELELEVATYRDAAKQPLAQSESLALKWMNEALNLRAKLATLQAAMNRITTPATVEFVSRIEVHGSNQCGHSLPKVIP